MLKINHNYLELPDNYLFAKVKDKLSAYKKGESESIIDLSIGDIALPIVPAVIDAMKIATNEMGKQSFFHGYAPVFGYDFLKEKIIKSTYQLWGCQIEPDELFVSDGAKGDVANIQEIFSSDCVVAICDPVYPVYLESNIIAGRAGTYDIYSGKWSNIIYLSCTPDNDFVPQIPDKLPDLIYICNPNNPTGTALNRKQLKTWVDYANAINAVIVYDGAYESYITNSDIPHSIYEIEGAEFCSIEIISFSKKAGFTGMRLGYTVIPKKLNREGIAINSLWARRLKAKYNGVSYTIQRAGEAVYSDEGKTQIAEQIEYYKRNATIISDGLKAAGYTVYGGVDSPYIWLKVPGHITSWDFFDLLLEKAKVVGTPGEGFGASGRGFFRLTAFGTYEHTLEAIERIRNNV